MSDDVADPPRARSAAGRLNIAVLLDHLNYFGRGYEGQLRDALCKRCNRDRHNLLFVYGGALDAPSAPEAADNVIFRMLRPSELDGVIVASSLISAYCGADGVVRMVEGYKPARLCSIGIALPGVPSLVLDNRLGMAEVTEHLVRDHGCRQPVFLAGTPRNPESEERFAGYCEILARYGVPCDPARVASGHFLPSLGRQAMEEILGRGVAFDAVVSANDSMAIGAMQALRKHGLRVPQDVAVAGFDDITLAKMGNPPLTTVAQPFETFAELAIGCIESQAAGVPVPELTPVPSRFVRRQSCGCGHHPTRSAGVMMGDCGVPDLRTLSDRLRALQPFLADMLKSSSDDAGLAADKLCQGLLAETEGEREAFQRSVRSLLTGVDDDERSRCLQGAINLLHGEMSEPVDSGIERAFYEAFSLVALSSTAAQVQHRLALDESYLRLLTIGEQSSVAFDLPSLRDSLIRGLPAAGVRTALLACTTSPKASELESTVWFADGVIHTPERSLFPAGRLVHPGILESDRHNTLLVFPLVHADGFLGTIAFDHQDGNNAYVAFRNQIATVLRNIRMHQEVLQKRLDAISVLAGGVAHDLNNTLGPLMVLPDVISEQLRQLLRDVEPFAEICGDLETIKSACLRAAMTIKDLLALSRQGKTPKAALELNQLVRSCLNEGAVTGALAGKCVEIRPHLTDQPLPVEGAESQLARAISNLVRNAIEAVPGDGVVTVSTARERRRNHTAGFEPIPPGDYAVLRVEDTGCGIAPEDLAHVFEAFFTKKQARQQSGSGLGLAIVHGVVKEHAGFIDVRSVLDAGTAFTVYLPAGGTIDSVPGGGTTPRPRTATILVVDDEPLQLRVCQRVLAHLGYTVETCNSGQRACAMFDQSDASGRSPFDLVLMDIVLGETLDGLETIHRIWESYPSQKFVVVSGHAPNDVAERAIKRGLPWLAKPYTVQGLANAVSQALAKDGAGLG